MTLLNETVHWGMKVGPRSSKDFCQIAAMQVPAAMLLFEQFRDIGPHSGLFAAVALSTCGEANACERNVNSETAH